MILAVALGAARLREPVVHVDAVARRDPLHQAVEHLLAVLGLVEAEVPEVVEQPSGLRDDFRVDPLDVPLQRIGRAEVVGRLVPQPGVPVPDGGESQPVHGRVVGRVRELVDVVRDPACRDQVDRRSARVVRPTRRGNHRGHVVQVNAMGQRRRALVERGRRIVERERGRSRHHDVLVRRPGDRRAIGVLGDRQRDRRVEARSAGARRLVPAAPHHRVAARHQEGVCQHGRVRDRAGVVAAGHATEVSPRFAAAVRRLVHHLVRAATEVDRLEDVEVERVLDLAAGVPRRELDVHDHGVLRVEGIDLAERLADDLLVLSDARPRIAAKRRRFGGRDLDPDDAGVGGAGRAAHGKQGEDREQTGSRPARSCVHSRSPQREGLRSARAGRVHRPPAFRQLNICYCSHIVPL